jgi:hypothetical protein
VATTADDRPDDTCSGSVGGVTDDHTGDVVKAAQQEGRITAAKADRLLMERNFMKDIIVRVAGLSIQYEQTFRFRGGMVSEFVFSFFLSFFRSVSNDDKKFKMMKTKNERSPATCSKPFGSTSTSASLRHPHDLTDLGLPLLTSFTQECMVPSSDSDATKASKLALSAW